MKIFRKIKLSFKRLIRRPLIGACIFALISAIVLEILARASVCSALSWGMFNPHRLVFLACLIWLYLRSIQAFCNNIRFAWIVGYLPLVVLSLIHASKFTARNEPLFPWDLLLFKECKAITNVELFPLTFIQTIIISLLLILLGWVVYSMRKGRLNFSKRIIAPLIFTGILVSVFAVRHMNSWREFCIYSGFHFWDQNSTCQRLGFVPTFMMNLPSATIRAPKGYSHSAVNEIYADLNRQYQFYSVKKTETKPINLIVFLAEGFWDTALLKNIKLQNDPIKTYHDILKKHQSMKLISPVIGGNTCNAEFELLTGLNTSFLPAGSIPFQQYIKGPVPSLASILSKNGYQTIAIHPFHKWFWNRDKVFPLLGFDKFISMAEMKHRQTSGEYISDLSLAQEIIEMAEASSKPFFVYSISMENHCPFRPGRYQNKFEDPGLQKASDILSEKQIGILQTYLTGIHHADLALKTLINHFSKSNRKTMIVFIGDHLAYLDSGYEIYKKGGYINEDEFYPQMYTQTAAIWTNFKTHPDHNNIPLSYSFFSSEILKQTNIPLPPLQKYLNTIKDKHPVIHTKQPHEGLNDYKLIQYDLLFNAN